MNLIEQLNEFTEISFFQDHKYINKGLYERIM